MLRLSLLVAALTAACAWLVPSAGLAATSFPVTITTPAGKVTVERAPRRIVSLSATATETLFAIGAGGRVVAADEQSDHPRNAPRTALSGFTPNVEAIAAYRPDLVVIAYDPKGLSDALRRLGIAVVHHDGAITGRSTQATALVSRMKRQIARVVASTRKRGAGLTVYHELTPDLYSAASNTFVGRVYGMFGLRNVADAADAAGFGYPQLSAEYLISASPDLIVLADSVCCAQRPATVASRPGWSRIAAVRSGSIAVVDDSIASRWGPRLVNFFRAISSAINRLEK